MPSTMATTSAIPSIRAPTPPLPSPIDEEPFGSIDDAFDTHNLAPTTHRQSFNTPRHIPTLTSSHDASDSPTRSTTQGLGLNPSSPVTHTHNALHQNALNHAANLANGATHGANLEPVPNPFNFTTQQYVVGKTPAAAGLVSPTKQDFGRRRGHKYARSSISHQIILEPTPRTGAPLLLPTSLPIPTLKEFRSSMTREQSLRWLWCLTHLAIAAYTQTLAHTGGIGGSGSLGLTALSHLLFFDTLGAFLCVAVDVGRNFEVWGRSSIRHPFGLQRAEVLAGLAMAIILLFMGLDIWSHGLQHALENKGGHVPHHVHHHPLHGAKEGGVIMGAGIKGTAGGPLHEKLLDPLTAPMATGASPIPILTAALLAILSTLISAFTLRNHARIGKSLRINLPSFLPSVLRNPSHLLTLSCSALLLVLPFLTASIYAIYDAGLGFVMAVAMVTLGGRLCLALGRMLLMSFPEGGRGGVPTPAPHSFLSSVATPATATRSTFPPLSNTAATYSPSPLSATHHQRTPSHPTAATPFSPTTPSTITTNQTTPAPQAKTLIPSLLSLSPELSTISHLKIFQVHHTLCIAAIKAHLKPEFCFNIQSTNDEVRDRVQGRIGTYLEEFVGPGAAASRSRTRGTSFGATGGSGGRLAALAGGNVPSHARSASVAAKIARQAASNASLGDGPGADGGNRMKWEVTVQIER